MDAVYACLLFQGRRYFIKFLAVVVIKIFMVAAIWVISISCSKCSTNERFSGNMIKKICLRLQHRILSTHILRLESSFVDESGSDFYCAWASLGFCLVCEVWCHETSMVASLLPFHFSFLDKFVQNHSV